MTPWFYCWVCLRRSGAANKKIRKNSWNHDENDESDKGGH
jgi:hypothetical protein